jgi:cytoskeletal protein CcmA (bactofilin family)
MAFFNQENKSIDHGAVDTIIGAKATFRGELESSGSVSICGRFEGKLQAKGEAIINKGSQVTGEINGGHVIISGKVDGNVTALHSLEITKSGRVSGDLTGGRIIIEDGAYYRGKVNVQSGQEILPEPETKESAATEPLPV